MRLNAILQATTIEPAIAACVLSTSGYEQSYATMTSRIHMHSDSAAEELPDLLLGKCASNGCMRYLDDRVKRQMGQDTWR